MIICASYMMDWEEIIVVLSVSDTSFKSVGCFFGLVGVFLPLFLFSMVLRLCVRQMLSL